MDILQFEIKYKKGYRILIFFINLQVVNGLDLNIVKKK